MKIITLGDGVVDYYQHQNLYYPGGSTVNVAVFARRAGAKKASWIGLLGLDEAGDVVKQSLLSEQVDCSRARFASGVTGQATVALNEQGDRVFVGTNHHYRVQSQLSLRLNPDDLAFIASHDIIHSALSITESLGNELQKLRGQIISYDFSSREYWTPALLEHVCPLLTYAFFSGDGFSQQEIDALFKQVHGYGVTTVIVTCGSNAVQLSHNGERYYQQPAPVKVIDTMGAGDSFIAAFLTRRQAGAAIQDALHTAVNMAAQVCGWHGAYGYGTLPGVKSTC